MESVSGGVDSQGGGAEDKNEVDDETLILADMSEKAIAQLKDIVRKILKDNMGDDKAAQLAETLATGKWTHDYPLTYEELLDLGLPVSTDMPVDVYTFMDLFPQPKQKAPSVQYSTFQFPRASPPTVTASIKRVQS